LAVVGGQALLLLGWGEGETEGFGRGLVEAFFDGVDGAEDEFVDGVDDVVQEGLRCYTLLAGCGWRTCPAVRTSGV